MKEVGRGLAAYKAVGELMYHKRFMVAFADELNEKLTHLPQNAFLGHVDEEMLFETIDDAKCCVREIEKIKNILEEMLENISTEKSEEGAS